MASNEPPVGKKRRWSRRHRIHNIRCNASTCSHYLWLFFTIRLIVLTMSFTGLTQHEKRALAQKIQETRTSNLKKTFAGEDSSKRMIFVTIGLILLTTLLFIGMIVLRFRKF